MILLWSLIFCLCGCHSKNKLAIASHIDTDAAIVRPCAKTPARTPLFDETIRVASIARPRSTNPIAKRTDDRLNSTVTDRSSRSLARKSNISFRFPEYGRIATAYSATPTDVAASLLPER